MAHTRTLRRHLAVIALTLTAAACTSTERTDGTNGTVADPTERGAPTPATEPSPADDAGDRWNQQAPRSDCCPQFLDVRRDWHEAVEGQGSRDKANSETAHRTRFGVPFP